MSVKAGYQYIGIILKNNDLHLNDIYILTQQERKNLFRTLEPVLGYIYKLFISRDRYTSIIINALEELVWKLKYEHDISLDYNHLNDEITLTLNCS